MKSFYKITILISFVSIILLGGKIISEFISNPLFVQQQSVPPQKISTISTKEKNQLDWKTAVLDSFTNKHLKKPQWKKSKKSNDKNNTVWVLKLPRGKSFVQYALSLQEIADAHGTKLEYGTILRKSHNNRLLLILTKGQDTLTIHARYSHRTLPKIAKLAIVIDHLDSINTQELVFLSNRSWKPTCIINSETKNTSLRRYLEGFHKTKVLLELPMEPLYYPHRNSQSQTILLHHSQKDIENRLNHKRAFFPKAIGFASTYGERIIENKSIMTKIFQYHKKHQLIFLDRTQSQRSLTPSLALEMGVTAFEAKNEVLPKNIEDFMEQKMKTAIRYGENVLIFNYSKNLLSTLEQYFKSTNWKNQGVELVYLSQLLEK